MLVYWSEQYTSDFSPYLRHIFTVKHIYLTLYIVDACHAAPIYSVPLYLLALLFTSSGPIGSSRSPFLLAVRAVRCACLPAPVCVAVLATLAPCAGPACSRCSRLYCSFSRRASARCSTLSARRKLFRDRFQAVDICSAVVRGDGWHVLILLYGLI